MFFITKPSAIRFHGNLAIYCYNCPECKLRLTKRVRSGKFLKMFSNLFVLKKYVCEGCQKSYFVHVKTYSTKTMPGQIELTLDILENSLPATENNISISGLIAKWTDMSLAN
jgi:transposase-like protein